MSKRHFEKKNKYNQLAIDLRNPRRVGGAWTVYPFEVEVGARGATNEQPWSYMYNMLGFDSDARKRLKWAVEDATQHCSHLIFLDLCSALFVGQTTPNKCTLGSTHQQTNILTLFVFYNFLASPLQQHLVKLLHRVLQSSGWPIRSPHTSHTQHLSGRVTL